MFTVTRLLLLIIPLAFLSPVVSAQQDLIYSTSEGEVLFVSEAPLELIKAESIKLQGAIDAADQTFAFSVEISTFYGFNSPLQREHFNENYLESHEFPKATFSGKIIEELDFSMNGKYEIRAKGVLVIHGIPQERIIKCSLEIRDNTIAATSTFTIMLSDHDISIPKVVYQKISEEIQVSLKVLLKLK